MVVGDGLTGMGADMTDKHRGTLVSGLDECACSERAYGDDSGHEADDLDVAGDGMVDGQMDLYGHMSNLNWGRF